MNSVNRNIVVTENILYGLLQSGISANELCIAMNNLFCDDNILSGSSIKNEDILKIIKHLKKCCKITRKNLI